MLSASRIVGGSRPWKIRSIVSCLLRCEVVRIRGTPSDLIRINTTCQTATGDCLALFPNFWRVCRPGHVAYDCSRLPAIDRRYADPGERLLQDPGGRPG